MCVPIPHESCICMCICAHLYHVNHVCICICVCTYTSRIMCIYVYVCAPIPRESCICMCICVHLYLENHVCIYTWPRFPGSFSHEGRVPCAIQWGLTVYLFYTWQCVYVNPKLLIYPPPPFPFGSHNSTSVTLFLLCR